MEKDGIRPFRFWVQPILPLAYDDSLSYLEVLLKVKIKLNEVIDWANNYKDELYQYVDQKTQENLKEMQDQLSSFQATINVRLDQQDRNIAQISINVNNLLNTVNSIISQFQQDINKQIAQFQLETQTQLREFNTQINNQIANNEAWVKAQIAAQNAYINAQLQAINLALDQNLIEANKYTDEKIKEALEGIQPGITDIIYPDDYVKMTIQEAINRLWYDLSFFTLTAQEYDDLDLDAQVYDDEDLTAYNYDIYGAWFLKYKGSGTGGKNGVTFTPTVSEDGIISWENDGNLPNPTPVNIRGPRGPQGPAGSGEGGSNPKIIFKNYTSTGVYDGSIIELQLNAEEADGLGLSSNVFLLLNTEATQIFVKGEITAFDVVHEDLYGVNVVTHYFIPLTSGRIIYFESEEIIDLGVKVEIPVVEEFTLIPDEYVTAFIKNTSTNITKVCVLLINNYFSDTQSYESEVQTIIFTTEHSADIPEPPSSSLGYLSFSPNKIEWIPLSLINPEETSETIYVQGTVTSDLMKPPNKMFPCILPPTTGTTGDVFTKTATGAEWAPANSFPSLPTTGHGYLSFYSTGGSLSKTLMKWQPITQKAPSDYAFIPFYDTTITDGLPKYVYPSYLIPIDGDSGQVLTRTDDGVAWEDPTSGSSLPSIPSGSQGDYLYLGSRLGSSPEWIKISQSPTISNGTVRDIVGCSNSTMLPPDSLYRTILPPPTGDTGSVLTKTATGAEWAVPSGVSSSYPTFSSTPVQIGVGSNKGKRMVVLLTGSVSGSINAGVDKAVFTYTISNVGPTDVIATGMFYDCGIGYFKEGVYSQIEVSGKTVYLNVYNDSSSTFTYTNAKYVLKIEYDEFSGIPT